MSGKNNKKKMIMAAAAVLALALAAAMTGYYLQESNKKKEQMAVFERTLSEFSVEVGKAGLDHAEKYESLMAEAQAIIQEKAYGEIDAMTAKLSRMEEEKQEDLQEIAALQEMQKEVQEALSEYGYNSIEKYQEELKNSDDIIQETRLDEIDQEKEALGAVRQELEQLEKYKKSLRTLSGQKKQLQYLGKQENARWKKLKSQCSELLKTADLENLEKTMPDLESFLAKCQEQEDKIQAQREEAFQAYAEYLEENMLGLNEEYGVYEYENPAFFTLVNLTDDYMEEMVVVDLFLSDADFYELDDRDFCSEKQVYIYTYDEGKVKGYDFYYDYYQQDEYGNPDGFEQATDGTVGCYVWMRNDISISASKKQVMTCSSMDYSRICHLYKLKADGTVKVLKEVEYWKPQHYSYDVPYYIDGKKVTEEEYMAAINDIQELEKQGFVQFDDHMPSLTKEEMILENEWHSVTVEEILSVLKYAFAEEVE